MFSLLTKAAGMLTAMTLLLASGAFAQTAPAIILVVDTVRIQEQSVAAKSVQTQIRDFQTKLQAQAKATQDRLKAEEVGLKQQQTLLAPEQFDVKRREFEAKVGEEQRKFQQVQQEYDVAIRNAQSTLLKALQPILKELMTEKGANMLLDGRMVMTSSDSLDVTAAAIERLNKKVPSIKVEVPKTAAKK